MFTDSQVMGTCDQIKHIISLYKTSLQFFGKSYENVSAQVHNICDKG